MTSKASSSSVKTKKPIVHSQARELARKVLENCDMERKLNNYKYPVNKTLDRAVFYTGLSKRTLSRIKSESKVAGPDRRLKSPPKRKKRGKHFFEDSFDRTIIYNTITEFYLQKKIVPTSPKLLVALRDTIPFPWGVRTFQRLLKKMGYRWRQCHHTKRSILIEKPDIVFKRYHYLKKIREFRQHNRDIYYLDETWVDNNLTFKKCWLMIGSKGILTDNSSANRLIVVSAGGKNGFLQGATLIFKAGTTTGDYHGQMNDENFEKWVVEKLLPSLPDHSVVVMNNAPYHTVQLNKPPTKSSLKSEMIKWLENNNISCDKSMRKPDLFKIIEQHKPVDISYKIDNILKAHGHDVLILPPYLCELNPMELAWAVVKRSVRECIIKSDLCLTKLKEVITNAISSVTEEDGAIFERYVQKLENDYWDKDIGMENVMEDFTLEVGDTSDEDSLSSCSDLSMSSFDSDE